MPARKIDAVTDMRDKQRTYGRQLGRHKKAMSEAFYFEALLIDYALLEDRLRSILYHMGLLANRQATGIWKKARPYLQDIVSTYKYDGENSTLGISNISGKMKIVRSVLLWTGSASDDPKHKHLSILQEQCGKLELEKCLVVLGKITDWCAYRNEVVHALMNKNIESMETELQARADEGLKLARFLDSQEKILKQGNRIRKSVNLPMN